MNIATRMMKLEQVAKIYSGIGQKSPKTAFGDGGCPWVMVEDLQNGVIESTSRKLTAEGMRTAKISPPETVFFSSTGTIGKVGITTASMAPSNNIIAVEFDSKQVYPLYGMYCLAALRDEFTAEASGAVYDSLRLTTFRKFQIPIPNIEQQKNIANKLEKICNSIELQKSVIIQMQQMVHATFDNHFGHAVESLVKLKSGLRIADFVDILLNGAQKKSQQNNKGLRYISTPMLKNWEILCDVAPVVEIDSSTSERYLLKSGDIVMNRINNLERLGHCGLISDEPKDKTVFGQNTMRLRASDKLNSYFLFVWLTHPFVKQYIKDNCKNSTSFQSSLNKQVILDLPLPQVDKKDQDTFAIEFKKHLRYIHVANQIIIKQQKLQKVWYNKIRLLQNKDLFSDLAAQTEYREKQFWITPSGIECFYDSYLECIQVPVFEKSMLLLSQLPQGVDVQFLNDTRVASNTAYGSLEHIRLHRINSHKVSVIGMQPVAYRADKDRLDSNIDQNLEDSGMLSEQQDFGYIRHDEEFEFNINQTVASLLTKPHSNYDETYNRFEKLPERARFFVKRLSPFQQAIYEEFLLALQPLACHTIRKQVLLKSENNMFSEYNIQDVIATVQLLENVGLIERRQGLELNYYDSYAQGEKRLTIEDHMGQIIAVDT